MQRIPVFLAMFFIISARVFPQWTPANGPDGGNILSQAVSGHTLYAGSARGMWISPDSTFLWARASGGFPDSAVTAIATAGPTIWAGTGGSGIYRTTDRGISWIQVNNGLINLSVQVILQTPSCLFAGTAGGLFTSNDEGDHWNAKTGNISGKNITSMTAAGSVMAAGTAGDGVFLSTNNGSTWHAANTGITDPFIQSLGTFGSFFFAGTSGGKVFSSSSGNDWQNSSAGLPPGFPVNAVGQTGTALFAATGGGGIFSSAGPGSSWTRVSGGMANPFVNTFAASGKDLLAGTGGGGICRSGDSGDSWIPANTGMTGSTVTAMIAKGTQILAGTAGAGFFISNDNGYSWFSRNNGLPARFLTALSGSDTRLFAGTAGSGLYVSDNQGISWTTSCNGITDPYISSVCASGSRLFAGTSGSGLFLSADTGLTWSPVPAGISDPVITSLLSLNQNVYAGTRASGVFASSDSGSTWHSLNMGLQDLAITVIAGQGHTLFAATPAGLFRLLLPGISWTQLLDAGNPVHAITIAFIGTAVVAGTRQQGVLLSRDNGDTWQAVNTGIPASPIRFLATTGANLFAGVEDHGVWLRPMSDLFSNQVLPDTVVLKQSLGYTGYLQIRSNVDWSVQGNIPDWFSMERTSGTGNDSIPVHVLKANLGYLARNSSLFLFSSVAATVPFTVEQSGKFAGTGDADEMADIRVTTRRDMGILEITATKEIEHVTLVSLSGVFLGDVTVNAMTARIAIPPASAGILILKVTGNGWTVTRKYEP